MTPKQLEKAIKNHKDTLKPLVQVAYQLPPASPTEVITLAHSVNLTLGFYLFDTLRYSKLIDDVAIVVKALQYATVEAVGGRFKQKIEKALKNGLADQADIKRKDGSELEHVDLLACRELIAQIEVSDIPFGLITDAIYSNDASLIAPLVDHLRLSAVEANASDPFPGPDTFTKAHYNLILKNLEPVICYQHRLNELVDTQQNHANRIAEETPFVAKGHIPKL